MVSSLFLDANAFMRVVLACFAACMHYAYVHEVYIEVKKTDYLVKLKLKNKNAKLKIKLKTKLESWQDHLVIIFEIICI